ncbi:MAG: prolipoprotein diacylglyceryl transferase [Celeribacter sp.]|jgi:phosphatidylglycerol:prolipoprotein diacylglycerol transferase
MQAMITFPEINPEIFSLALGGFEFALRWYALAYIAGILAGWWIAVVLNRNPALWHRGVAPMTRPQVDDLVTWVILGIVLGGRLGFVLFYRPGYYLENPGAILQLWQGGMSFHGGLLGVVISVGIFSIRQALPKLSMTDVLALCVPPGLFFGRLANFINGELWGRPTDVPWGMKFPTLCTSPIAQGCEVPGAWFYYGNELTRHPSQLYEAALEGLLLGGVLLWMAYRRGALKQPGLIAGVFFAGYGAARFVVEHFRQADPQFMSPDNPLGFVIGAGQVGITMGQLLSLPMVVLGLGLIWISRRHRNRREATEGVRA